LLRGAQIIRCDLFHRERLKLIVRRFEPDCVVNLACLPLANIAQEFDEEARQSILEGAGAMVEAALCHPGLSRFVHVSSSMVYGDFVRDPNPEDAPKAPKNTYGRYKLESEQLVRDLVDAAGREHVTVRPSGVYGPTDINERVVQLFCEKALLGEPLVVNRSETTIDFTWIEDIADGLALAATHKNAANETFNMASGRGRTLGELVDILRSHFPGLKADVRTEADPTIPARGGLDVSKAARLLGYAPRMQLEAGVEAYLRFLSQHMPSRRMRAPRLAIA
jgi:nucleoside-diphosphate-sugar epimerase